MKPARFSLGITPTHRAFWIRSRGILLSRAFTMFLRTSAEERISFSWLLCAARGNASSTLKIAYFIVSTPELDLREPSASRSPRPPGILQVMCRVEGGLLAGASRFGRSVAFQLRVQRARLRRMRNFAA